MINDDNTRENIAQTLARELPTPVHLQEMSTRASAITLAPEGWKLHTTDLEKDLPAPLAIKAVAKLDDATSFLAYVQRHRSEHTMVWCDLNRDTFALSFRAVLDEHNRDTPAWRRHQAEYTPAMSAEWKVWTGKNNNPMPQMDFASFIEQHEPDIATEPGYPTSLEMLQMATNFEANADKSIKSVGRLQSGGVELVYVDNDTAETQTKMKAFERFQIGIPVFRSVKAGYRINARLKYRVSKGLIAFWYELIRPDLVHQIAADELLAEVRAGLGDVPLLMGSCR